MTYVKLVFYNIIILILTSCATNGVIKWNIVHHLPRYYKEYTIQDVDKRYLAEINADYEIDPAYHETNLQFIYALKNSNLKSKLFIFIPLGVTDIKIYYFIDNRCHIFRREIYSPYR